MKYKWTIVITTVVLIGGIFFVFSNNKDADNQAGDLFSIDFGDQTVVQDDIVLEDKKDEEKISENTAKPLETQSPKASLYTNDKYKFSFEYPKGVAVSSFKEGIGDIVLIQSKDTKTSAQIFIIPYDEEGPITSSRILEDLPSMVIKNEKKGTLGGADAIAFLGKHESLGDTYEIWFVRDESLYQIITKVETAQFLVDMMKTWKEI